MSTQETRAALMDAAVRLTTREGTRAATARGVAAEAGVNQALVFYHFDGVDGLLRAAFDRATRQMVERYAGDLAEARSFAELHAVGVRLARDAGADGSAALLAHVVSAAHTDPEQAALLTVSLQLWRDAVADAVRRVLAQHQIAEDADIDAITRALAASTIGMITLDTLDDPPFGRTLPTLAGLAGLVDRAARLVPAPLLRRVIRRADG